MNKKRQKNSGNVEKENKNKGTEITPPVDGQDNIAMEEITEEQENITTKRSD